MKYLSLVICLKPEERTDLEALVSKGSAKSREIRRANILLMADTSGGRKRMKDVVISQALGVSAQTISKVKKTYLGAANPSQAVLRKKRVTPPREPKLTGDVESRIIAIACSPAPEGRARWTLRLIADKVKLDYCTEISHTAVATALKKTGFTLT